jgi:hypothetical protein
MREMMCALSSSPPRGEASAQGRTSQDVQVRRGRTARTRTRFMTQPSGSALRRTPSSPPFRGPRSGLGLGLALIADFRVASPEARFAANFVKLGFHPGFGLTYTLPQAIGSPAGAARVHDRSAHTPRRRHELGTDRRSVRSG